MQRVYNPPVRRQATDTFAVPTAAGVSGGKTASSVDVGTSLLIGASGSTPTLITDPGATSTSTPTPDTTSSSNQSSPSLSTGSVLAIIITVFLVFIGAMILIYVYFKRRTASRARHLPSRGPPPVVRGTESLRGHDKDKQRDGGDGHGESKNNPSPGVLNSRGVRAKSPDSGTFGLFEKDPSIRSVTDEKANTSDDHFDPSTMATFAKYQGGPANDLSILPHPRPLAAREEGSPTVSWDSGTVISDPLLSLHASVSGSMSPTSVLARQTPQTTDSAQHRWESAEVLMMDEPATDPLSVYSDALQDPFSDDSAPRRSNGGNDSETRSTGNPFFNASQHNPFAERSTRSRTSSVSTAKRSRSYSVASGATARAAESENALFSLLAALDPAPVVSDDQANRTSMQTTATSVYPPSEGGLDPETPQAF
jgi:hypothetical protein